MRSFVFIFLLTFSSLPAIAAPSQQELDAFYAKEDIADEVNAFAQLRTLEDIKLEDSREFLDCILYYDSKKAYIPITDSSCINEENFITAWDKNSELISHYAYVIKLLRLYEDKPLSNREMSNFIAVNKLISAKIGYDIANKGKIDAYNIWANNIRFLQMAIADKQGIETKSSLFLIYEMYVRLAPTLLKSNLSGEQKEQIRGLLNFEIANHERGWDITDSLAIDFHNVTDEIENPALKAPLALEVYKLAQDAKKLYAYDYNEMEEKVQQLGDKYSVSLVDAAAVAAGSEEKATAMMIVGSLSTGLKLMVLAKFKDIQAKIAALKY